MTSKGYKVATWISLAVAAILIILGCFAPRLFTGPSYNERLNFTETGNIGDTIGGIMGPFVAIAGVLLTFVAFLMQVRANEIQRGQLFKSFRFDLLHQKLDSRKSLQLLLIDINNTLNDIEQRGIITREYCDILDSDPFAEVACKMLSLTPLERYRSIDRNSLYEGFSNFVEGDYESIFRHSYSKLDFYLDGVRQMYDMVYFPYTKDIMEQKLKASEIFPLFFQALFNSTEAYHTEMWKQLVKELSPANILNNGMLCFSKLAKILNDEKYNVVYCHFADEYAKILSAVNPVGVYGAQTAKEMRKAINAFSSEDVKGELKIIQQTLETALRNNTPETIQSSFEKQMESESEE